MRSTITFSLGALILSLAAVASARPDLNSFLNTKVSDTHGLVAQIQRDPQVSDRYVRHFSMSKREVVAYASGLHRAPLAQGGVYTVYSVPTDGHLKMHYEKLKKGEPMFVDASGRPTLIVKCGNPVVLGPRKASRGNPVALAPTAESGTRSFAMDAPNTPLAEAPATLVALAPAVPDVPVAMINPEPPLAEPPVPTVPASAVGGGGRFPWIAALPLLVPIFGSGHHGGGGTEAVPEPASLLALGVSGAALLRRRRKV